MYDCLRRTLGFDDTTEMRGQGAVWGVGDTVYKCPTEQTAENFARELRVLAEAPPGLAKQVHMVAAAAERATERVVQTAPENARVAVGDQIIAMPYVQGHEAYDLLYTPDFCSLELARALVRHARAMAAVGYANTDIKLENIIVGPRRAITFLDWGGVCKACEDAPSRTYVVVDRPDLTASQEMKAGLTLCLGELHGLNQGVEREGGAGIDVQWHDVAVARGLAEKVLVDDTLALYRDFMLDDFAAK